MPVSVIGSPPSIEYTGGCVKKTEGWQPVWASMQLVRRVLRGRWYCYAHPQQDRRRWRRSRLPASAEKDLKLVKKEYWL